MLALLVELEDVAELDVLELLLESPP